MRFRFSKKPVFDAKKGHLLLALSALTFLLWLGASAILPMLPLYLSSSGTSSFGVGIVMASYYIGAVATQIPIGKLTDSIGARPIIVGGLALFSVASLAFAAGSGVWPAVIFRSIQGIGAGAVTVAAIVVISTEIDRGKKGASLGVIYGSQMIALAIGPVIGSLLGSASLKLLFIVAGLLGILTAIGSAIFFLFAEKVNSDFVGDELIFNLQDAYVIAGENFTTGGESAGYSGEIENHRSQDISKAGKKYQEFLQSLLFGRPVFVVGKDRWRFVAALSAFGVLGYLTGSYEATWALYLHMRHASSFEIGLSWASFALPYAALSIPAGYLAEHASKKIMIAISLIWSGFFAALYPEIRNIPLMIALAIFEASGAVVASPAITLVISQSADIKAQGRAQGRAETVRTLFAGVGAAAAGSLFSLSYKLPFFVMAFLLVAIAILQYGFL